MSQDNILQSQYLTRPVVRQRNSVTLVSWSGYVSALAIPSPADDAWVRQRVLAEQIPLQLEYQITNTLVYFLQDTTTQTNILQFISQDNDNATEVALASQNDSIIAAFAPRYANTVITEDQVEKWRDQNNAPAPPPGQQKDKP
jgi:hypothetical protein